MKTRKFLSVLVAVCLLVSTLIVVGVLTANAAETEVGTADAFATMTDGTYKLTADLDLTGIDTLASFTGTLDGNGKTVTVSKPLFNTLSGEVKNLTIVGAITSNDTAAIGALANTVSGNLTVTNVTNGASVTANTGVGVGGFIGTVNADVTATLTNVTNSVPISGGYNVGGIIGTTAAASTRTTISITGAKNNGTVSSVVSPSDTEVGTAGLVGFVNTLTTVTIHQSINTAAITAPSDAADDGVAGLVGGTLWNGNSEVITVTQSANTGAITTEGQGRCGGIAGRIGKQATLKIDYCYNTGAVSNNIAGSASGILGHTNKRDQTITNCFNVGTLTCKGDSTKTYSIGSNSNSTNIVSNNYYLTGLGQSNSFSATPCDDQAALNTELLAIADSEYCVNPALNDGYAILKWQCVHSDADCEGKCVYCAEVIGAAGAHTWSDWAEKTPATATQAKVEERTCSVCSKAEERTVGEALGVFSPVDGVYNVENENQLVWLVYQINKKAVGANVSIAIKNDITLTNGLDMIMPTFSGKFDGEGHTISGLNNTMFNRTGPGFTFTNVTLEGEIDYTEIDDVQVRRKAASVSLYAEGNYVLENVVSNVNIRSTAPNLNAGGLFGFANWGQITNCTYGGTFTIDWVANESGSVGGLVGWLNDNGNNKSYITNSRFTGELRIANNAASEQALYVGGLLGRSRNAGSEIITGCVSNGSLTITATGSAIYVGGLVGIFDNQKANLVANCVVNNTIYAPAATDGSTYGSFVGWAGAEIPFTNCVSLIDAKEVAACGNGTLALTNCYFGDTIKTIGDAFTMGGVEYQRYNFGYLNTATSALVSTGEVSKDKIDAFMSYRDKADKHDVRFVLLADLEALKDVNVANVSIVFTLGEDEVRVENGVFGGNEGTFVPYQAVLAAGEPFFAAEGYAYFGLVMVDIPDGAWDSVTITVTNAANDEDICTGMQTYAGIQE